MPTRVLTEFPAAIAAPAVESDVNSYLEDAAHYPGGHAGGVVRPRSVEEVSAILRRSDPILVVGAQSSLTGGATPFGDIVLVTDRLNAIEVAGARVGLRRQVQALGGELAVREAPLVLAKERQSLGG